MISHDCPRCGHAVSAFTKACSQCGVPNTTRTTALTRAGALAALGLAIGLAGFALLRWQHAGGEAEPDTTDEFAWLSKAMAECDAEAAKATATLHFLVVPLASNPVDDADWRARSRNDIGNAILLVGSVTLDGLKSGHLRLSREQYDFRMRDDATSEIYKWTPSSGVKKFLTPAADAIKQFKIQFTTARRTADLWGATFQNAPGTCYWVNAIIGN